MRTLLLALLAFVPGLPAQGPGLGNLTYGPGELFAPVAVLQSPKGHGNCAMVKGYLLLIWSADGGGSGTNGGIDLWDVSDPRSPTLFRRYDNPDTHGLREAHGFAFSNSYPRSYMAAQSIEGVQFWDCSDPGALVLASEIDLPGISSGDYEGAWWVFWQAPWVYVAGVSQGLYIVDASDPTSPVLARRIPSSALGGLAPSQAFALGNLLVLTKSQSDHYVTCDISDPVNPVLLQSFTGARGYSHVFAGGMILTSGGDGGPVQMFAHRVTHAGQLSLLGSSSYPGFSNGGYGSYQDGFFHSGMSNMYGKCDLTTFEVVGTGTSGLANRDEDFGQVLGNLVWVGDDHAVGSALVVHQTQPDSRGPDVHWVHPADGASGVAPTGRVGISMSDNVDLETVDTTTFGVRKAAGGPVLAGKYSVQMGLVNFTPDAPLEHDTAYQVDVAGIADLVGNTGAAFRSTFTTSGAAGGSAGFLTFDLAAPGRVWVLFDARATVLPAWLQGWGTEPVLVNTTAGDYTMHWRDFPAGIAVLGGNADAPMAGAGSNYLVVTAAVHGNVSAVSGRSYQTGTLALGSPLYIDRTYTYTGVPPLLMGQPYILTANDDKFSTSSRLGPECNGLSLGPVVTGGAATLDVGSVAGTPPFTFSWSFGDGSPATSPAATSAVSHAYGEPGRYPVTLTIGNAFGSTSCSGLQIVHDPLTPGASTASAAIAHDGTRVFVVNADNDTVTAIDESTTSVLWERPVGAHPRTLAVAPGGDLWVVNQDDASISVLQVADGALLATHALPRASQPYGLVFRPDGQAAYVSLQAPGGIVELDPATGALLRQVRTEGVPRGIAVTHDSRRLLAARFLSRHRPGAGGDGATFRRGGTLPLAAAPAGRPRGVVWELDTASLRVTRAFPLRFDPGPDTERSGRGVPNYLGALRISPDGRRVLVPAKKDNTARGLFRSGEELTFESRTRTMLAQIDLWAGRERFERRIDLNDRDMAQAVAFSPLGDLFVVASQGSNVVDVFDAYTGGRLATLPVGRAPQGLVFNPAGTRLFVDNFMDRSVTVYDTTELVAGAGQSAVRLADVATVASEALSPQVLRGKQIFYNAADRRMNLDGYISCASCHLDGGADGQVWDFTQAGEGLRNTIPLTGRAGLGHGRVHWTANFDEIQDFENDIRAGFAGAGFLTTAQFGVTQDPLGAAKSGLSPDLDALAAYVSSLDVFPPSPYRDVGGGLTPRAQQGQTVFVQKGCTSCHAPPSYTDGLRHDVGTHLPASGLGLGQPLAGVGIETPTLRAVWSSPPYLHHGQAPDLRAVLTNPAHVGALTTQERDQLVAFLREIE